MHHLPRDLDDGNGSRAVPTQEDDADEDGGGVAPDADAVEDRIHWVC